MSEIDAVLNTIKHFHDKESLNCPECGDEIEDWWEYLGNPNLGVDEWSEKEMCYCNNCDTSFEARYKTILNFEVVND